MPTSAITSFLERRLLLYNSGMNRIKDNLLLYIAIGAPILLIAVVAASIYLPNIGHKPKYNFVFSESYYYSGSAFMLDSNGKVQKNTNTTNIIKPPINPDGTFTNFPDPQLYLYDVQNNSAAELRLADAQKLQLNSSKESPDGFHVDYGSKNSGSILPLFFSTTDYSNRYLLGHGSQRKLNLPNLQTQYYQPEFEFIGWIMNK